MHGYTMIIVTLAKLPPKGFRTSLPPDAPLWQGCDFELRTIKAQEMQDDLLTSPSAARENLSGEAGPGAELSPERTTVWAKRGTLGEGGQGLVRSGSLDDLRALRVFTQHLLFLSSRNSLPPL